MIKRPYQIADFKLWKRGKTQKYFGVWMDVAIFNAVTLAVLEYTCTSHYNYQSLYRKTGLAGSGN